MIPLSAVNPFAPQNQHREAAPLHVRTEPAAIPAKSQIGRTF